MKLNIYIYKTKGVSKNLAHGYLQGIEDFLKNKTRFKPIYRKGSWTRIHKQGQHYFNVFLTKNSLTKSNIGKKFFVNGNIILKSMHITDLRQYQDKRSTTKNLKNLRARVSGYSELARLLNLECCDNYHCAFNYDDLDTLCFMHHIDKNMPLCNHHKIWKSKI